MPLIKACLVSMQNNLPFDIKKYNFLSRYDPYGRFIVPNPSKKERQEVKKDNKKIYVNVFFIETR